MDSFGLERSIEPRHALAQQAWKIDNTMTLRSDEVLIDVKIININLASFNEILDETGEDRALLCQRVLEIVRERGKLHNPVTNSGRVLEELEDWLHNLPGTSVDILRLAGLVGPGRHPGRFFAGKTAPDGEHGVNLVHLEDVIGAITLLLQAPKGGHIYNICAPMHPARNVFYPQMARQLGMEPPEFRDGTDNGKGKVIDGNRICNELGFEYQYPDPLVMPME